MDPITHTMLGAVLGETGLRRRTPLGRAALLLGANLPDVDVACYLRGPTLSLACRRGITHGLPAVALLPFLLAGCLLAWDRGIRLRRDPSAPPADPAALLGLSALAVATHPLLDWLNNYGMRWLMPFDRRWFYGDTLFIADLWVWLLFGAILLVARLRRDGGGAPRLARAGLAAAACYVALMKGITWRAEAVTREALASGGAAPLRIMASPVPVDSLARRIVAEVPDGYRVLDYRFPSSLRPVRAIPRSPSSPAVESASKTPEAQAFLTWARFPFWETAEEPGATVVYFLDARYALERGSGFGALAIRVTRPSSARASP